jgi:gamma-glutamylcyclotransferase (GGCT)/AIG2-like uncharacterized protein YtfP
MTDMLFVYGTLRPDANCAMGQRARASLQRESQLVGSARTQGTLFNLGNYQALGTGSGMIVGSLYQLKDPSNTLMWLDEYEGITNTSADEYERVLRTALSNDEQPVKAWVYVLKHTAESAQIIPSGDWLMR